MKRQRFYSVFNGIVNLAAQTWYGVKTFSSGIKVGNSTATITQLTITSVSLTPTAVSANTTSSQTFALSGAATTDFIMAVPPSAVAGLGIMFARVSSANTGAIRWQNFTSSPKTPPAGTYILFIVRG